MARELQSWKEIAAYLDITIRTAQKWESERGLPVRRLPGPRGRVFALEEDLDAWKSQLGEQPEQGESQAPQSDATDQPTRPTEHRRWIVAAAALLAVSLSIFVVYSRTRTKEPATFQVRGNAFLAISASGEILWQKTFPALLHPLTPPATPPSTAVVAVDLDGDGDTEVLFNPVFENPGAHELICWNVDGTERWRYAVRKKVRSSEQTFEPLYWIERFVPLASSGAKASQVLVVANHHQLYPSQVALLSADGVLQGEYWHPGHLHVIERMDLDHDGSAEILLGGISNGETAATIVALDPRRMNGTPKVSKFPEKALLDMPRDQEVARILFPRSSWNQEHLRFNNARQIRVLPDGLQIGVAEDIQGVDVPTIDYRFDTKLQLQSIDPSDGFLLLLAKQYRNRRDAADPWAIEKSKLGPVEVIRPGNSSASPRTSSGTSPASD